MGCNVQEVNVDWLREAALANKTMTQSDGAAVHRDRLKEHPEMFGDDIRRRLEDGAKTTSTEYILARRTQVEVRKQFEQFFETHDLLLTPTTPIAAPTVEGHDAVEQAGRLTRSPRRSILPACPPSPSRVDLQRADYPSACRSSHAPGRMPRS